MALLLHRSDNPLALADGLSEVLRREPLDVFTPEVVVVGARGVERWLTQRLAHRLGTGRGQDGVSAGLDLRSPASLTALLLDRERDDPWNPDRLVWPLLDALDAHLHTDGFESVARHLGGGREPQDPQQQWEQRARRSRRYAVARRMAGLFSSYLRERPALLEAWEHGESQDGAGGELAADLRWQPVLWRACVDLVIERGLAEESPVARHRRVVEGLRSGALALPGLPGRLSMFGHTRLAESELELLEALAERIDVHLWLPHPSPQLWDALATRRQIVERAMDDSAIAATHPLLASLGRDVRELERSLLARSVTDVGVVTVNTSQGDQNDWESTENTPTRLQLLQADIRQNASPSAWPQVSPHDRSIQVHACHGPARQVEVLRELLVALIDHSDGHVQPRDVIVMCPDIETFAPLIHAAFGRGHDAQALGAHPGQGVRVQLADRALSATNPLVEVAQRLIRLVAGRVGASEILDLVALPAVAQRFGFDDDTLDVVARWVAESGIRWGLDAQHRGEYGLGGLAANTWEAGLDRLALGVALAGDSAAAAGALLPLDDVGSGAMSTATGLLELLEVLETAARRVRTQDSEGERGTMTVSEWVAWLRTGVLSLTEVPQAERWQVAQFERELALIGEAADADTRLRLTDVRVMVEQRWGARPTRSNFRTGAVTVCTMVPMRSVPHKVVIALGIDDSVYPRSPVVDGDDVLARSPLTGERDARSEDSQLLLDAVMAAQETFIALYSGFDERTGARKPPAVPLQGLLSASARTGCGEGAAEADDGLVPQAPSPFWFGHPLQAFDERNFTSASFVPGGTYDHHALAGAEALRAAKATPGVRQPLVPQPLPERQETAVSLDDLVAFYENPAREFLRRRLEITVPRAADEAEDAIPIALDGLDKWKIGDRLLAAVRAGVPLPQAADAERRRGELPPGRLGEPVLQDILRQVQAIVESAASAETTTQDVLVDLPSGVRIRGVVSGVADRRVETLTYSSIAPKHVIGAWVRLLGLAAGDSAPGWSAVLRGKRRSVTLQAPNPEQARRLLAELVEFRDKGMRFPLGVPPKAASAFTHQYTMRLRRHPDDVEGAVRIGLDAAERAWASGMYPERGEDVWWARIYGPRSSATDLNSWNSLAYWGPRIWGPIHDAGGRVS